MKKYLLAFVLCFSLSAACVMAQDNNGRKKLDKSEIIQKRTDRMVEKYGLDEKQAKDLLELNTQYADKMFMGGRVGPMKGMRRDRANNDSVLVKERPSKEQIEAMMKTMNETREAYNNGLKKIMTDDQFSKYEEDQKKMMKRRPRQNNKRK